MAETDRSSTVFVIADGVEAAKKFAVFAVTHALKPPYENERQCVEAASEQPPPLAARHVPYRVTLAAGRAVECVALDTRRRT